MTQSQWNALKPGDIVTTHKKQFSVVRVAHRTGKASRVTLRNEAGATFHTAIFEQYQLPLATLLQRSSKPEPRRRWWQRLAAWFTRREVA